MRERTDGQGFATRAIHAGERPDPTTHAHRTPIYATATFALRHGRREGGRRRPRPSPGSPASYFYSRTGNPTNRALEEKVASLEGAEDAVVVVVRDGGRRRRRCSRTSAPGDHVVVGDELFAITKVLLDEDFPRRGIDVTPRRHDRPRRRRGGDHPGDEGAVLRDVDEPAAADAGPRRAGGDRPPRTG